jgi:hypothetical protein
MQGPAIFLAQFAGTKAPFDKLETIAQWAAVGLRRRAGSDRSGAPFIRSHMIRTTTKAFDDFAATAADPKVHARILGLDE